jgi:hypothetical protein
MSLYPSRLNVALSTKILVAHFPILQSLWTVCNNIYVTQPVELEGLHLVKLLPYAIGVVELLPLLSDAKIASFGIIFPISTW